MTPTAPKHPRKSVLLQEAVNLWTTDKQTASNDYGRIQTWRVATITSMNNLFRDKITFTEDFSSWDASAVTDMRAMFANACEFNSNISGWNVNAVTSMRYMFANAHEFNSNLSDWNVSSVTGFSYMFYGAEDFDQVLCWDTSKVDTTEILEGVKGGRVDPN